MTADACAATEAEVVAAVAAAAAAGETLEIRGHGTRAALVGPSRAGRVLDLAGLTGVRLYEPNELVLTAAAATPLSEIRTMIAAAGQHLAFDPPDFGPLWGRRANAGTLGGALSVGLGGPRRPKAGAVRDHLLGFRAVNGFGEVFAGGGRVVKNVTGFDLPKLMVGAQGALGVLTEATLKVTPAPDAASTVILADVPEAEGLAILAEAAASPGPVSSGAYLPASIAARIGAGGTAAVVLRFEGVEPAVEAAYARTAARWTARASRIDADASADLWSAIGGAWAFAGVEPHAVFRISGPRAAGGRIGAALRDLGVGAYYYDWFGGLILAQGLSTDDGGAAVIRERARGIAADAHVTLIRGLDDLAAPPPAFQPPSAGVANLSRKIRSQFDPKGVFNPGRWAGTF